MRPKSGHVPTLFHGATVATSDPAISLVEYKAPSSSLTWAPIKPRISVLPWVHCLPPSSWMCPKKWNRGCACCTLFSSSGHPACMPRPTQSRTFAGGPWVIKMSKSWWHKYVGSIQRTLWECGKEFAPGDAMPSWTKSSSYVRWFPQNACPSDPFWKTPLFNLF